MVEDVWQNNIFSFYYLTSSSIRLWQIAFDNNSQSCNERIIIVGNKKDICSYAKENAH
jgi:hypothetical protein